MFEQCEFENPKCSKRLGIQTVPCVRIGPIGHREKKVRTGVWCEWRLLMDVGLRQRPHVRFAFAARYRIAIAAQFQFCVWAFAVNCENRERWFARSGWQCFVFTDTLQLCAWFDFQHHR